MPKRVLYCDECDQDFTVSFKGSNEPSKCPFCGEDIDTEWNSSPEDDES